jgi:cell wall-associated NlpC family hydrolase
MNQKRNLASFLICFSFIVLVAVVVAVATLMPKESSFGFMQTLDALNATNATSSAANATSSATNATSSATNATSSATNATSSATNTTLPKTIQITSADTKGATDGKSLDIDLQIQPFPVTQSENSQFKITFLQPSSQTVQVHVDYDFSISKMNSEVFRASSSTGQPLLHTAEGIVSIPYKFSQEGEYSVQVSVMGINFIPIKTEQALFDLKVS